MEDRLKPQRLCGKQMKGNIQCKGTAAPFSGGMKTVKIPKLY